MAAVRGQHENGKVLDLLDEELNAGGRGEIGQGPGWVDAGTLPMPFSVGGAAFFGV
jgi:hypothetical protein